LYRLPPPLHKTAQSNEDYLKWAKAAYQNIQQQKTETVEVEDQEEEATPETEPVAETTETETKPQDPLNRTAC
jgi:fused signal recognition particle receptor